MARILKPIWSATKMTTQDFKDFAKTGLGSAQENEILQLIVVWGPPFMMFIKPMIKWIFYDGPLIKILLAIPATIAYLFVLMLICSFISNLLEIKGNRKKVVDEL